MRASTTTSARSGAPTRWPTSGSTVPVDPDEDWADAEARYRAALGVTRAETGSPEYRSAMDKLASAADLKVPAALAVDSVRYSITDAEARAQWADVRVRAAAGRRVRRRLGVGEQRADQ